MQEFAFKVRYRYDRPPIPFSTKLLCPLSESLESLYQYSANSLYSTAHRAIYTPDDSLGLAADPLAGNFLEDAFRAPGSILTRLKPKEDMHEADRKLLAKPVDPKSSAASRERPIVPWLRRPEYISAKAKTFGDKKKQIDVNGDSTDDVQHKDGLLRDLSSRQNQINAIEQTFKAVAKASLGTIKHPTNPNLKAVEMVPIFPDFEYWPNEYHLVHYEDDIIQAIGTQQEPIQEKLLKVQDALLKPFQMNQFGTITDQMALYTPTTECLGKLQLKRQRIEEYGEEEDIDDEEVYDYELQRVMEPIVNPPNFPFFLDVRTDDGGAFYSRLEKKISMRKKRASKYVDEDLTREDKERLRPDRLLVKLRSHNEAEQDIRQSRLNALIGQGGGERYDDDDALDEAQANQEASPQKRLSSPIANSVPAEAMSQDNEDLDDLF